MSWLRNIDRRVIYVLLFILVLYPLVKPMGLPVSIGPWTKACYDYIEKNIKPGDKVVVSFDYSSGGAPDVDPQAVAVVKHLFKRGARIIGVAFVDQGVLFATPVFDAWGKQGKKDGTDFVNLGFLAGGETAVAAFGNDPIKAFPKDINGKDTASMPIMQGVKTAADFKFIAAFATGAPGPSEWVRQVGTKYKTPYMAGLVTVMAPGAEPYLQSKQMVGLLAGLRGAAEYENAQGEPGRAVAGMDAQSMGHIVIILFVILGNVLYLLDKPKKAKA